MTALLQRHHIAIFIKKTECISKVCVSVIWLFIQAASYFKLKYISMGRLLLIIAIITGFYRIQYSFNVNKLD